MKADAIIVSCPSCGRLFTVPESLGSLFERHRRRREGDIAVNGGGRVCHDCAHDVPIEMLPIAVEQT